MLLIFSSNFAFLPFYGDHADFVLSISPWFYHGGCWNDGVFTGEFLFSFSKGAVYNSHGSRLLEYLTIIYFSLDYCFFAINEYYRDLIPILE